MSYWDCYNCFVYSFIRPVRDGGLHIWDFGLIEYADREAKKFSKPAKWVQG